MSYRIIYYYIPTFRVICWDLDDDEPMDGACKQKACDEKLHLHPGVHC